MTFSGIAFTYPTQVRGVLGRVTDAGCPYRDPEAQCGAREENRTPDLRITSALWLQTSGIWWRHIRYRKGFYAFLWNEVELRGSKWTYDRTYDTERYLPPVSPWSIAITF